MVSLVKTSLYFGIISSAVVAKSNVYLFAETQTTTIQSSKITDPRATRIDILTVTNSALLVVVICVLLSFIIAVIYWRCLPIDPSSQSRNAQTNTRMLPSYCHLDVSNEICMKNVNPNQERPALIAPSLAHITAKQELSESLETDYGTISDKDAIDYRPESPSDASDRTEDTLSLLSCQENPSPRVHRKKKKRRLRHEYWQSDTDIETENRYAVLDAAKFTTI